jgi:hypothetical protein
MTCRWMGSDQPRAVSGRHKPDCADETCRGCQECHEPHCRVCGRVHADGTCAECLAATRADLHEIGRLCDALPEEVEHRGVEGEAMMLLGPAADIEARQHAEASYLAGRLPEGWLETGSHGKECPLLRNEACLGCDGDERHPLIVLASWQDLYAAEFDHEITRRATVEDAVGYLDRNLTYAASWPHAPFEDFVRDLRGCVSHLEAVLHDGVQVDRGAPCLNCNTYLRRIWAGDELPWSNPEHPQRMQRDGWVCARCRETSTDAQYDLAVKADYIQQADWLPAEDMAIRTGVKASTVRSWASEKRDRPALVRKTLRAERTVYSVEDVEREREARDVA